jgi:uncharacterized protein (DUF58 family)
LKSTKPKKKRDTIYIVPTRYGFLYGTIIFMFLAAGTIYENNSLLFATATLVTFGLVCMHQTHLNVNQVKISELELESGFSGQTVQWKMRLANSAPVTSFSINIRDAVIDVPPGEVFIENIPVLLRKRGRVGLKELKISSTYPFGLFYAWKWWKGDMTFFVYPSLQQNCRLPEATRASQADLNGQEDFIGHREYVPGDSAHHIDWKVQARKQKTMIKLFDTQDPQTIHLDFGQAGGVNVEERLSFLATVVRECYKLQRPFGLRMPREAFGANSTRSHYRECLRALALYGDQNERSA